MENTTSAMNWLRKIESKIQYSFLMLDIKDFYPISKNL